MGKVLNKHFTKESLWAANKPIKDAHRSLLEKHKFKPLHECYFTALLVTTTKQQQEQMRERTLRYCQETQKMRQSLEEQPGSFLKVKLDLVRMTQRVDSQVNMHRKWQQITSKRPQQLYSLQLRMGAIQMSTNW